VKHRARLDDLGVAHYVSFYRRRRIHGHDLGKVVGVVYVTEDHLNDPMVYHLGVRCVRRSPLWDSRLCVRVWALLHQNASLSWRLRAAWCEVWAVVGPRGDR
jgi:hypothetical protein